MHHSILQYEVSNSLDHLHNYLINQLITLNHTIGNQKKSVSTWSSDESTSQWIVS